MKELMKKLISTIGLILLCTYVIKGQSVTTTPYPKIGDIVEDHEFTDLDNYSQKSLKISDFRGQWLIIDFWSRYCTGCIASFPKMNDLQIKYGDKVKILMVGLEFAKPGERDDITRSIYELMKSEHNLQFTVAFDQKSREKYSIRALPHIFIINPEGILISKAASINAHQIEELLIGSTPLFLRSLSTNETIGYNEQLPLLTNGASANGGIDTNFLFRSLLADYTEGMPINIAAFNDRQTQEQGKFELTGVTLKDLFLWAYIGKINWSHRTSEYQKYYRELVLEISDSTSFIADKSILKGLFAYSLIVPPEKASEGFLRKVLKSDLENFFGYNTSFEKRKVTVYNLVLVDSLKAIQLKTNSDLMRVIVHNNKYEGKIFQNYSLSDLAYSLFYLTINKENAHMPIFDRTGLDFNVDINIQAKNMTNLESINNELVKSGLKIIRTIEEMEVIVVRDPIIRDTLI